MIPALKLIAGLGNPGTEYAETRHNIGFMVLDHFMEGIKTPALEQTCAGNGLTWKYRFGGQVLWLLKPMTFMNLSGDAVAAGVRRLRLTPAEVLVVIDDVDLPLGRIRFRRQGGTAGHRGLESVIKCLETSAIPRLRVGIGRAENCKMVEHVLSGFSPAEQPLLQKVLKTTDNALKLALKRGIIQAMNTYNGMDLNRDPEQDEEPNV